MLTPAQEKRQRKYWRETTADNYQTMLSLYRSKRYSACLFFGHLVIEKALKVLVIQQTHNFPPRIHDLLKLAKIGGVRLTPEEVDLLEDVNEFNMEARYPEVKYQFYKKCTKEFIDRYFKRIKKFYHHLCHAPKPKK